MADSKPKTAESTEPAAATSKRTTGRSRAKPVIGLVIGVVVVALLLIFGLARVAHHNNNAKLQDAVKGLTPEQQAQYYSDHNEYALAEKVWQDQLAKTSDRQKKESIYFLQTQIAIKFKKYDDAEGYAKKAQDLDSKSVVAYQTLASVAQAKGDKSAARKYWQQAITALDPKDPAYNLKKHDLEDNLASVK